ncbi:GH3 auxin-responsive promoter family protein [Candidatus Viridilinea mediisalina]|uniref:GH3 auxin-responsive promoter n=1 Tax=Candidatus Viridilinea mediisalina TaxID=2024553 RepID=A0A2A6RK20_9CHLR|nr:GH3 auxin-responsive promoter family protein [Candidatus Viridilinea mediisalina]PDW03293.1 hypothetical protein CJ255_09610 [Candidatus Viridilinea mediisalina]
MLTHLAHNLWLGACLPGSYAFRRALRDVAGVQWAVLRQLLRQNATSRYGRVYDFASITSVAEYQRRVPLVDYDHLRPAIEQIAAGVQGVLTSERVLLLEPTSGSSAATKLIPYTAGLQASFQRALSPWLADLLLHDPQVRRGRAYWQVTPLAQQEQRSSGGLPIGFAEDSAYLGGLQQSLSGLVLATPPGLARLASLETLRYVTLLALLRCADLSLISVWNPTFLSLLLERLAPWGEQLVRDLAQGTLSPPEPLTPALAARLGRWLRPDPQRAALVQQALKAAPSAPELHRMLWPRLRLVSCWADGYAARSAYSLARNLPQAILQPKGLIATEGFVSFPLLKQPGAALALRSHFFEFLPSCGGEARLAHQLALGASYEVVISTAGGLYRYRLYDQVEVVGHLGACPLLRFQGKNNLVADWFGEKLNEQHVRSALEALFSRYAITPSFAMLACNTSLHPPAYTLYLEAAIAPALQPSLAHALEQQLQQNIHYRYCRNLGQLGPLRIFKIHHGAQNAYLTACQRHGQRSGDIKALALHRYDGWETIFVPEGSV